MYSRGTTKHGGRIHESGIEEKCYSLSDTSCCTLLGSSSSELMNLFTRLMETLAYKKLHCMYIIIRVTKCITKQQLSKNSFSLAFGSDHT